MIVVAIKDTVANEFGDLAAFKSVELARRSFGSICQKSPYAKDLQLFKVADYDPDSGQIVPDMKFIANGGDNDVAVQL